MRRDVQQYCKHCIICQLFKKSGRKKYGLLLPAKTPVTTKWKRVNVDLWGPATVKNKNGDDYYKIHIMTMLIDPATGWFEVVALKHCATALEAQRLLDSQWVTIYPK